MGNMVNVTFLTDHFDWIEKNPEKFVSAINSEMSYGTEAPMREAIERRAAIREGKEFYNPNRFETPEAREARIHYVTVHKFQHADMVQLIYAHANSTYAIHELPYAIDYGWLETKSNPEIYVQIFRRAIDDIRKQADRLEQSLDKYEKEHEDA